MCPIYLTLCDIYFDKLEEYLDVTGCDNPKLLGVVVILFLYADNAILLARIHGDLDKKLKILRDYYSKMGMTINIDKVKVMIIKSKKINYDNFIYDKNYLEKVSSYKYLGIDIHYHLNYNYSIEKMIIGIWKAYYDVQNNSS